MIRIWVPVGHTWLHLNKLDERRGFARACGKESCLFFPVGCWKKFLLLKSMVFEYEPWNFFRHFIMGLARRWMKVNPQRWEESNGHTHTHMHTWRYTCTQFLGGIVKSLSQTNLESTLFLDFWLSKANKISCIFCEFELGFLSFGTK